jgi:hypothetical protein
LQEKLLHKNKYRLFIVGIYEPYEYRLSGKTPVVQAPSKHYHYNILNKNSQTMPDYLFNYLYIEIAFVISKTTSY